MAREWNRQLVKFALVIRATRVLPCSLRRATNLISFAKNFVGVLSVVGFQRAFNRLPAPLYRIGEILNHIIPFWVGLSVAW